MKEELKTSDHNELLNNKYAERQSWLFTLKEAVELFGEESTLKTFHLKELPDFTELKTN
jgi:hypothetical protein